MLHWHLLISSTLRLVDLVDSSHEPGGNPLFNREVRKGRDDSLWIELGILLLEFLREQSAAASHDYVSIVPLLEQLTETHPDVKEEDVQYICSVLSTPCLANLPEFSPDGSIRTLQTKQTNLIEQLGHGKRMFRLTAAGTMAISLATGVSELLYADEDAAKILKALKYQDYLKVGEVCSEIRSRLVESCHEIRRALSRPGYDEIRDHFVEHCDAYQKIMQNVQETIRLSRSHLSSPDTEDAIEAWGEKNPQYNLNIFYLRQLIAGLNETLEVLGRTFAQFIEEVSDQNTNKVGMVDFSKLSLMMIDTPPSTKEVFGIWNLFGPCASTFAYVCPKDFKGCLKPRLQEKSQVRQTFDHQEASQNQVLPSILSRLLEKHRDDILAELQKEGVFSLQTAFQEGFFVAHDDDQARFAVDLIGVYVVPDHFGIGEARLGVGVRKDRRFDKNYD
jgi:hypothetical protein